MVARLIVKRFSNGQTPLTARGISEHLSLPQTLVNQSLDDLVGSNTFTRTCTDELDPPGYLPAVDIGLLTVHRVMEALERTGSEDIGWIPPTEFAAMERTLKTFSDTVERSAANKRLQEI